MKKKILIRSQVKIGFFNIIPLFKAKNYLLPLYLINVILQIGKTIFLFIVLNVKSDFPCSHHFLTWFSCFCLNWGLISSNQKSLLDNILV